MKKISVGFGVLAALGGGCVLQLGAPAEEAARREARPLPVGAASVDVDDLKPADEGDDVVVGDPATAPAPTLPPWDNTRLFTGARDGRLVGTIGPAANLDLPTDILQTFDDGYYTEIAVFAVRSDGRRVMLQLGIDNADDDGIPFFVPGVGKRLRPGYTTAGNVGALACEGPDSGNPDEPFDGTPFDEEPCDVGVDTEQDPEDPQALQVTLQATFRDANGDCPDAPGGDLGDGDFGEEDLPDLDNDGDGDLPGCGDDGSDGDGGNSGGGDVPDASDPTPGNSHPLATSSFILTR